MEMRYQMRAEGISISALVDLTEEEKEILESKDLEGRINEIATKLRVAWAVEVCDKSACVTVSKQFGPVVGDLESDAVKSLADGFMARVRKLKLPQKSDNPQRDPEIEKGLEFAHKMLNSSWEPTEDEYGIAGAVIMGYHESMPMHIRIGSFPAEMLRKMFEAYIKVYDHEQIRTKPTASTAS